MRENEAAVQTFPAACVALLGYASLHLTILDPEVGEEELIQAVAAALAKLSMPQALTGRVAQLSKLRKVPGGS